MISFTPPELRTQIIRAKGLLEDILEDWDFYPLDDDDHDPEEYDDVEITTDTQISICLANALNPVSLTIGELLWMTDCLAKGEAVGRSAVRVPNKTIFYISPLNGKAVGIVYEEYPLRIDQLDISAVLNVDGVEHTVDITQAFNPFHLFAEKYFECDERVYPSYGENDVFAIVSYPGELPFSLAKGILDSYLFQLATCHGLVFSHIGFPSSGNDDYADFDSSGDEEGTSKLTLRELDISKGMPELYGLYMEGVTANNNQWSFISFVKAVEFVSMTVLKRTAHREIRARLMASEALRPDAAFMDGLIDLVEKQKEYAKQREYIRRALSECCDVFRFVEILPSYLNVKKPTSLKDEKAIKTIIDDLSDAIVDTRNYFVHAKAAYEKHGKECPDTDLPQFLQCMKEVAYQAIVWYQSLSEHARVTGG